jgi:hypothetical protein
LPTLVALRLDGNSIRGSTPFPAACRGPTLRALQLASSTLGSDFLTELAKCPALERLWFLSLAGCNLRDSAFHALMRSARFECLTLLDLTTNSLTGRGLQALADWPLATRLRWLNLCDNPSGDSGARALVRSKYLTNLQSLAVSGRGKARLRKRFGPKVVP